MSTTLVENSVVTPEDCKVFVGNLSFKTSKVTLTSFAETCGKVLETTIITRGTRSLGYGFIQFETAKEAEKAAKELNHKSLDGRDINVEVARPKSVVAAVKTRTRKPRKSKRDNKKTNTVEESEINEVAVNEEESIVVKIGKKSIKKVVVKQEEEEEVVTSEEAIRKKRNQKNKKRQNKRNALRAARVTEPSKTTLFVANLPYATTDEDLNNIFKNYKLVSAHVARMRNERSKGYGFVEFENEQEQIKALETVKDVILEGRAVYLKIALSEQKIHVKKEEEEEGFVVKKEDIPAAVPVKKEDTPATLESEVKSLVVNDTKK